MKKLLFILLTLPIMFTSCATENGMLNKVINKQQIESISKTQQIDIARSGCCSWHGGVCGCTYNGRVICCDGSISPSCRCW